MVAASRFPSGIPVSMPPIADKSLFQQCMNAVAVAVASTGSNELAAVVYPPEGDAQKRREWDAMLLHKQDGLDPTVITPEISPFLYLTVTLADLEWGCPRRQPADTSPERAVIVKDGEHVLVGHRALVPLAAVGYEAVITRTSWKGEDRAGQEKEVVHLSLTFRPIANA